MRLKVENRQKNLEQGFSSPIDTTVCIIIIAVCAVVLIIKEPFIEWIDNIIIMYNCTSLHLALQSD